MKREQLQGVARNVKDIADQLDSPFTSDEDLEKLAKALYIASMTVRLIAEIPDPK